MSRPSISGGSGSASGGTTLSPVTAGIMQTKAVPLANTEVSHTLPASTKRFKIQNRDNGLVKLSYVTGFTTVYWTIFPGVVFGEDWINLGSLTLYLQSTKPSQTLEITSWS
jgi:hypothetical protein